MKLLRRPGVTDADFVIPVTAFLLADASLPRFPHAERLNSQPPIRIADPTGSSLALREAAFCRRRPPETRKIGREQERGVLIGR